MEKQVSRRTAALPPVGPCIGRGARATAFAVASVLLAAAGVRAEQPQPQDRAIEVAVVNTPLAVLPPREEAVTLSNYAQSNEFRRIFPDGHVEAGFFIVPPGKELVLTSVSILSSGDTIVSIQNSDSDPHLPGQTVDITYLPADERPFASSQHTIVGGIAFAAGRKPRTNILDAYVILHGTLRDAPPEG